ncbi:MAG TPA: lmo0937 family membrane protein [Thermomicrobiaceae bacterium]|nr:lmo0937 family membrane protein [Thermomicrobiaceae bacterium]
MLGAILWAIIVILVVLWLIGFLVHLGGSLIHLLLVVAVIVLIYQLLAGRRSV